MTTSDSVRQPRRGGGLRLWAILRLSCPRCLRGALFRSLATMRDECPACGLKFGREDGYYTGAIWLHIDWKLDLPKQINHG